MKVCIYSSRLALGRIGVIFVDCFFSGLSKSETGVVFFNCSFTLSEFAYPSCRLNMKTPSPPPKKDVGGMVPFAAAWLNNS